LTFQVEYQIRCASSFG